MTIRSKYICLALLLCCSLWGFAQPDAPNPAPTPFGFVELLIGAGALYGGRKVHQARKKH
jgi:hypothetical protein